MDEKKQCITFLVDGDELAYNIASGIYDDTLHCYDHSSIQTAIDIKITSIIDQYIIEKKKNKTSTTFTYNEVDIVIYCSISSHYFRNHIYPEYKQNRNVASFPNPDALKLVKEILRSLPNTKRTDGIHEVDDFIVSSVNEYEIPVIVSSDKDFYQVPDVDIIPIRYNTNRPFISRFTKEEAHYNLMKQILMGDSVDNIKGIPRVGIKKAEQILHEKGIHLTKNDELTLKTFLAYYKHYNGNLISALENMLLNTQLVTLKTEI